MGIVTTIKLAFGNQIIHNTLNPVHLAIGTRGYWLQSHILHVPHRVGFFSSGPPRLQVLEGAEVFFISMLLIPICAWIAFLLLLIHLAGLMTVKAAVSIVVFVTAWLACILALQFARHRSRRALDSDWEEWKVSIE